MIIPQVLDQLEAAGARAMRAPDGKVVVYEITTGRQFRRFPDSAADMVASGRFSAVWPQSSGSTTAPAAATEPVTPLVEPPPLLTAATDAAVASAKRRHSGNRAARGRLASDAENDAQGDAS